MLWAGFAVIAAVGIAEIVLALRWNRSYFRLGVPIFARRVERARGLDGLSLDALERSSATAAARGFAFRRLDAGLIAFREQGFGFAQYTPIMRGVIRHDPAEPGVVVMGLVNWFVVALVVVLVATMRGGIVDVLPYVLAAFAILYFIQGVRFWRVASAIRATADAPPY